MLDAREPVDLTLKLDDLIVEDRASKSNVRTRSPRKETMNTPRQKTPKGLKIPALFTRKGVHPFDEIEWERRKAVIKNEKGETVFEDYKKVDGVMVAHKMITYQGGAEFLRMTFSKVTNNSKLEDSFFSMSK